jgi:hypothetical protein
VQTSVRHGLWTCLTCQLPNSTDIPRQKFRQHLNLRHGFDLEKFRSESGLWRERLCTISGWRLNNRRRAILLGRCPKEKRRRVSALIRTLNWNLRQNNNYPVTFHLFYQFHTSCRWEARERCCVVVNATHWTYKVIQREAVKQNSDKSSHNSYLNY